MTPEAVVRRGRAAPHRPRPARRSLPAASAGERSRADRRDRVDVREGAAAEPGALERRAAGRGRLAQDPGARARPGRHHRERDRARADRHRPLPAGLSRRALGRRPRGDRAAPDRLTRRRSPPSRAFSPRTPRPTSRERSFPSTAASRAPCSEREGIAHKRVLALDGGHRGLRGLRRCCAAAWVYPTELVPVPPERGAAARRQGRGRRRQARGRQGGHLLRRRHRATARAGSSGWCRSRARTVRRMVPEHALVQPGSSFEERRRTSLDEMARSEKVAAAVALRCRRLRRRRRAARRDRRGHRPVGSGGRACSRTAT